MKKVLPSLAVVLFLALGASQRILPPRIEARMNRIGNSPQPSISAPARRLHRRLLVADLKERALYQARRFDEAASRSKGALVRVRNSGDLKAYLERRHYDLSITAAFLGIEGVQALDDDLRNIDLLFNAGFRMMSPTHFADNSFAGSASGIVRGGLTAKGRELVKQMEARHMMIDLAHASPRTIDDVLAIATRPVLVSHTGVRATCDSDRNLTDGQIRSIATTGGLIGIAYFQGAVCGTDVRAIVKAIRHVSRVVGVGHVGIGSDFDGATRMPFDTTGLAHITEALLADGFTEPEVAMIMGGNAIRFVGANLP